MSATLRCVLQIFLRIYRGIFSPLAQLLGAECRFYPTCSAYAQSVLAHEPPSRAVRLIAARLGRCHPWHPGGIDLPPTCHIPSPCKGEG